MKLITSIDEYKKYTSHNFPIRKLTKMQSINDGNRLLVESIMVPEVILALADFKSVSNPKDYVLIGGLAMSFYGKPRYTEDVDILTNKKLGNFLYFKKHREHAYQHNKTHVEIEVLDSVFLKISDELVQSIFDTAFEKDGMLIASPSGLIALKLGRFNYQDMHDIETLKNNFEIDLSTFNLSRDLLDKYDSI